MKNKIIIQAEDISKMYRLGEVGTGTISHDLNRWWHRIRGKEDPYLKLGESNQRDAAGGNYVWALKQINFDVRQGEVLGIIGRNGAGKSTLLKILSRVTQPTTGNIKVKGRIASLLEVGTGFHPELTGRDNIYLNGAILGMTKAEIRRKFDEIVDFSGVQRYIDTPVKRYSSGMYVRLAFAVAAHLEAEILIVDEVLAVGDAEFQNKCMGKMSEISSSVGRTVLFVSHNMGAVKRLCSRALLMENGQLINSGPTPDIIEQYLSGDAEMDRQMVWHGDKRPGDHQVKLNSIRVLDEKNAVEGTLTSEMPLTVEVEYEVIDTIKDMRIAVNLMSYDGTEILASSDYPYQPPNRIREKGVYRSYFVIPGNFLNLSRYHISVDIDIPMVKAIAVSNIVSFTVDELIHNELGLTIARSPSGVIHPVFNWKVDKLS